MGGGAAAGVVRIWIKKSKKGTAEFRTSEKQRCPHAHPPVAQPTPNQKIEMAEVPKVHVDIELSQKLEFRAAEGGGSSRARHP